MMNLIALPLIECVGSDTLSPQPFLSFGFSYDIMYWFLNKHTIGYKIRRNPNTHSFPSEKIMEMLQMVA
jgi:hypothetical protein